TGLAAGVHTLSLELLNLTDTNSGDFFSATVQEIPASIGAGQDFLEPNDNQEGGVCNEIGPGQALWANLSSASDRDVLRIPSDCTIAHATIHIVVTGGAVMDVLDEKNGGAELATNVTSFDHTDPTFTGDDLAIFVHSGSPRQYKFSWSFT